MHKKEFVHYIKYLEKSCKCVYAFILHSLGNIFLYARQKQFCDNQVKQAKCFGSLQDDRVKVVTECLCKIMHIDVDVQDFCQLVICT